MQKPKKGKSNHVGDVTSTGKVSRTGAMKDINRKHKRFYPREKKADNTERKEGRWMKH